MVEGKLRDPAGRQRDQGAGTAALCPSIHDGFYAGVSEILVGDAAEKKFQGYRDAIEGYWQAVNDYRQAYAEYEQRMAEI